MNKELQKELRTEEKEKVKLSDRLESIYGSLCYARYQDCTNCNTTIEILKHPQIINTKKLLLILIEQVKELEKPQEPFFPLKDCDECEHWELDYPKEKYRYCLMAKRFIEDETKEVDGKPDWCPLSQKVGVTDGI